MIVKKLIVTAIYFIALFLTELVCLVTAVAKLVVAKGFISRKSRTAKLRVMALGTFFHRNWYESHLKPIAQIENLDTCYVITTEVGVPLDGITWMVPPLWMLRLFRTHGARALYGLYVALRFRPTMIVGYFIFPNALLALLLSKLSGAKACYQMCAGPREIERCGVDTTNAFLRYVIPSKCLGALLYRVINHFDLVVVRGNYALDFCRQRFKEPYITIITGSIDTKRFSRPDRQSDQDAEYDVITACRVTPVKRMDMLVDAAAKLRPTHPGLKIGIIGDGPELESLMARAKRLGVENNVMFIGKLDGVETYYHRAKLYAITSDTEGLSIALAEAMCTGLPAVATNVGDLPQLVHDNKNGKLIPQGDVAALADAIAALIDDDVQRQEMSEEAYRSALDLTCLDSVARRWAEVFAKVCLDYTELSRNIGKP